MSKKIAVIGLGNTLRRDDGIGITVLESLLAHYARDGVDYLNFGTASFDLIYRLQEYDTVLLIDGIDAGLPAGELKIFSLDEVSYILQGVPISSHELNLKGLFELCAKFGIKSKIYVAGIQVEDAGYGMGLTDTLKDKETQIVKEISAFIDRQLSN